MRAVRRKNLFGFARSRVTYHRDVAGERRQLQREAMEERKRQVQVKKLRAQEIAAEAKIRAAERKIAAAEQTIERAAKKASSGASRASGGLSESEFERIKAHMESEIAKQEDVKKRAESRVAGNPSWGFGVYQGRGFTTEQLAHFKSREAAETYARTHGLTGYSIKRAFDKTENPESGDSRYRGIEIERQPGSKKVWKWEGHAWPKEDFSGFVSLGSIHYGDRKSGKVYVRGAAGNPSYLPRFIRPEHASELINLYHLARTPLSGTGKTSRYDRMIWASGAFHKEHPEVSSTGAYKDLDGLLSNPAAANPESNCQTSPEYQLGYSLGQRDRETASLHRTAGELEATFLAKFDAERGSLQAFTEAYEAGISSGAPAANPEVRFSDGYKFDVSGPLRIVEKGDGLYVVGQGMLVPISTRAEGHDMILRLSKSEGRANPESPLYDRIQEHLASGGVVAVRTALKHTNYLPKHAAMFRPGKAGEDGVYVQRGKHWDYVFPQYIHFGRYKTSNPSVDDMQLRQAGREAARRVVGQGLSLKAIGSPMISKYFNIWWKHEAPNYAGGLADMPPKAESLAAFKIGWRTALNPQDTVETVQAKISKLVDEINLKGNTRARAGRLRVLKEQRDKLEGLEDITPKWGQGDNPEGDESEEYRQAKRLAELFHGRPVKEEITTTEAIRSHDWHADFGPLVELRVKAPRGYPFKTAKFPFSLKEGETIRFQTSPDGRQFYLRGGDQEVDLDALGMGPDTEWFRDSMNLGEVTYFAYQAGKKFHGFKLTEYTHKVGSALDASGRHVQKTKIKPVLIYDSFAKKLSFAGGLGKVETKHLVDGTSPGIVQ